MRISGSSKGDSLWKLEGHSNSVISASLSPELTQLASTSFVETVQIWDARNGALLQVLSIGISLQNISFDYTRLYLYMDLSMLSIA